MGSSASEKMMMRSTARGERKRDLRVPEEGEERRFLDFPSPPIAAVGGLVHRPSERRRAPGSFGEFSRSLVLGLSGYKAHVFLARQVGGSEADDVSA